MSTVAIVGPCHVQRVRHSVACQLWEAVDTEVLSGQGGAARVGVSRKVKVLRNFLTGEGSSAISRSGNDDRIVIRSLITGEALAHGRFVGDDQFAIPLDHRV